MPLLFFPSYHHHQYAALFKALLAMIINIYFFIIQIIFVFFAISNSTPIPSVDFEKRAFGGTFKNTFIKPIGQLGRQMRSSLTGQKEIIGKVDRYAKSLEKSVSLYEKASVVNGKSKLFGIQRSSIPFTIASNTKAADKEVIKSAKDLNSSLRKSQKGLQRTINSNLAEMDNLASPNFHNL